MTIGRERINGSSNCMFLSPQKRVNKRDNATRLQKVLLGFANSVAGTSGCFLQLAWQP